MPDGERNAWVQLVLGIGIAAPPVLSDSQCLKMIRD
jgi:hypothetical protein